MRKLKDKEFLEARIKITNIREVLKEKKGCHSYKDKLICIKITLPTSIVSTCFKADKKGKRDLLKFIKENCYL